MPHKNYELRCSQFLPITIDQAWDFFSDPRNLSKITPPKLGFKVVSQLPDKVYNGLHIEYRVSPMLGIPMKWVSLIKNVKEPLQFADEQLKGPYAYWDHLHTFKAVEGGVMMEDYIQYRLPFQNVFPWIKDLIVAKQLNEIFEYRKQVMIEMFGK